MKPPRLNNHRNKRGASRPPQSSTSFQKERLSISRQADEIRNLSREITSATSKMEKWLEAMTNLSYAIEDPKVLRDVIGKLSKLKTEPNSSSAGNKIIEKKGNNSGTSGSKSSNSSSGGKGTKKSSTPSGSKGGDASDGHKPFSEDGDSLYDLINAPGMTKIVDNVMKTRKTRLAGKKDQS